MGRNARLKALRRQAATTPPPTPAATQQQIAQSDADEPARVAMVLDACSQISFEVRHLAIKLSALSTAAEHSSADIHPALQLDREPYTDSNGIITEEVMDIAQRLYAIGGREAMGMAAYAVPYYDRDAVDEQFTMIADVLDIEAGNSLQTCVKLKVG